MASSEMTLQFTKADRLAIGPSWRGFLLSAIYRQVELLIA